MDDYRGGSKGEREVEESDNRGGRKGWLLLIAKRSSPFPSPRWGEGGGEGRQDVRRKFSDFKM